MRLSVSPGRIRDIVWSMQSERPIAIVQTESIRFTSVRYEDSRRLWQ
nr:MAG TPA: hypothetical protein [Caudoviricetes sp.]